MIISGIFLSGPEGGPHLDTTRHCEVGGLRYASDEPVRSQVGPQVLLDSKVLRTQTNMCSF